MPLTNYGEPYMLQALFGGVTSALPTPTSGSWYIGLIKAKGVWTASTSYAQGDIIIPTDFVGTNKIFVCNVAGTSGSSQPTWVSTGEISDGATVKWVDVSVAVTTSWATTNGKSYFYTSANILTSNEVSGTSYARQGLTNSQSAGTWVQPTTPATAAPASTNWGTAVNFPSSGGSWGYVVGFFLSNVSSGGTAYAWNTLSNYVPILVSGMTLTLPSSTGITVTLS